MIPEDEFKKNYPLTHEYLKENKEMLLKRDGGKIKSSDWYSFSRNQALDIVSLPKIFTPDISSNASFSIDTTGDIFFTGGVAGGYGVIVNDEISELYVLGLLNSKLLDWYLKKISTQMRGGWYSFEAKYIKSLPIVISSSENKPLHDQLVNLVTQMLEAKKQIANAKTEGDKDFLENKCNSLDRQIDNLVYKLYELTEEEIKIVKGNG